jgi:hypothetical protein
MTRALVMRGIGKRFGDTLAIDDATFRACSIVARLRASAWGF